MALQNLNVPLLVKFLQLSGSSNEHEALSASRRANKLLSDARVSWSDVIGCGEDYVPPPKYGKKAPRDEPDPEAEKVRFTYEELVRMFERVRESVRGGKSEGFIESLYTQFTLRRSLSPKQRTALKKFYDNCR